MRQVIVPSDLVQSFSVICLHHRYHMIHHAITNICAWFKSTWERQLTLNKIYLAGIAMKKSRGTKSHLHTWRQDGHHNRFPLLSSISLIKILALQTEAYIIPTLTTTQLHATTFLALPSRSILHRPLHSPSFLLSSTCGIQESGTVLHVSDLF